MRPTSARTPLSTSDPRSRRVRLAIRLPALARPAPFLLVSEHANFHRNARDGQLLPRRLRHGRGAPPHATLRPPRSRGRDHGRLARAGARPGARMRAQGGGRVVNIASIGALAALPHLAPYCASKFALAGLSESLRVELAKDDVVVTSVFPGLMRTGSGRAAWVRGDAQAESAWFRA